MEDGELRTGEDHQDEMPRWLRLAREEIELRLSPVERAEDEAWEREHQMQLILRARYPDVPIRLAIEFSDRLQTGDFTWDAFDEALEWLEETKWFRKRRFESAA
jgi:hypothetical protein